ncbi:uncharacterized protein LTR77_002015 [Saxophila tyrrhenica]|uniref:Methyltransferase type 11 domain-containing protein n=1 Tax=Saxophila tyrrhenica TaxID=1690608 RepID=A0AAV9PIB0_9PEZI|nr:hypothetical protein LTR77_002015 [Saxophila tyrrhenica]
MAQTSQPQRNTYFPGHQDVKHHQLRTAENCAAYLLPALKEKAASSPNLTLLDVGAGPGTITASLAKYMPNGHVTATDISDKVLQSAAAHAEQVGVNNITFQTGSVYSLPFPDDSFDVVHVHQVLCYLDSPVDAVKELLRVAKPTGSVIGICETDMRSWSFWPLLPALQRFHQIQMETHEANGGTNVAGPQLISWALKAGVRREQVRMTQGSWCYSERAEKEVWGASWASRARTGEVGKKALSMGLATKDELEEMAKAWEAWAVAEDGCFALLNGEILIQR